MSNEEQKDELVYDRMPGSDAPEDSAAEQLDLNFGLGEEPVEEPEDEEVVAEAEETEVEAVAEAEEPVAEDDSPSLGDQTPVTEAVEAAEEPAPEEPRKHMVPKSRLDEVLAKQKALEKQLDELRAQKQEPGEAPEAYDFDSKEVEYQNLVLDGEAQKAAALRKEIRTAERAQLEYEFSSKIGESVSQSQQATALQQAASELEDNFPVFDRNSDQYNEGYTQEVIDLRDAFIMKGENPVAALTKAAKFVLREYDLVDMTEAAATPSLSGETAPRVDEVAKKRAEVSRKLKAAESQPPEMPGESSTARGEKALDIASMTEDEFNALPEATLRRLRGDIL
jgi:hypothetical protein